MTRGLRVSVTTLLSVGLSCSYAFDTHRGLPMIWKLLLVERSPARALTLLSCLTIIFGGLWYAGREIWRYYVWRAGKSDWNDVGRELAWSRRLKRYRSTSQVSAMALGIYHELRSAYRRALHRWPHRQADVRRALRRPWTRNEWRGLLSIVLGQAVLLYFSFNIYCVTWPPLVSITLLGGGLVVVNLLAFMLWIAGDDDDEGGRLEVGRPKPIKGAGIRPSLRVGQRVERGRLA